MLQETSFSKMLVCGYPMKSGIIFEEKLMMPITLKYVDSTYMIRAVPSNPSGNVHCTILAQSCLHGAMAGYPGFTTGIVNGRRTYLPFYGRVPRLCSCIFVVFLLTSRYQLLHCANCNLTGTWLQIIIP